MTDAALRREALRFTVTGAVSPAAQARLSDVYSLFAQRPEPEPPASTAAWDARRQQLEARLTPIAQQVARRLGVGLEDDRIGGVPVVRLRPGTPRPGLGPLLFLHGGANVLLSARSSLILPALMAAATGREVLSIDYSLAPRATWRETTGEVMAVWLALLTAGLSPGAIGLLGDSAGGGLAAGAVLRLRDAQIALPGALILISPWSDVTATGDSYQTLADLDPCLTPGELAWSAAAYAVPQDQRHPYVSPVYGDYASPFPPTLIQGGTRELFLSHCVRHYQAIRSGGQLAVLDLYEGMPHVFQGLAPDCPETRTAIARAARFFEIHLEPASPAGSPARPRPRRPPEGRVQGSPPAPGD